MTISIETLMAFADGELAPQEQARIAQIIDADPDLKAQLAMLKASHLPFAAAYEHSQEPELPAELTQSINALCENNTHKPKQTRFSTKTLSAFAASILMAFALGVMFSPILSQQKAASEVNAWAKVIADYHSLYERTTVSNATQSAENITQLLQKIALKNQVPDLSAFGYKLVRAQELGYKSEPLVQLVYLKPEGKPLALCFMEDKGSDFVVEEKQFGDMPTLYWRQNGLRYALVAHDTPEELSDIQAFLAG